MASRRRSGRRTGHGELHDELIAFGVFAGNRGGPPGGENIATCVGQLENLRVSTSIGFSVRHNLAVALEALHRLVDLADIQRPCSARLLLEHLLQAVDTGGLLRNKRQQCIANRHNSPFIVWTCRRSVVEQYLSYANFALRVGELAVGYLTKSLPAG